jgi:hypothetical protein
MKNILFSGVFAILAILAIGAGIVHESNGNHDAAVRCYVAAFAAVIIPAVYHYNAKEHRVSGATFAFLNKQFFYDNGQEPYTAAELALLKHIMGPHGKSETQKGLQSGALRLQTYARALRFEIADAATGTIELLNAATAYAEGSIPMEWNLGTLADGTNIAVSHIGLGFVADGTVTTAKAAIALATQPNAWPAALRNGRLRFSQSSAIKAVVDCMYCGPFAASFGRPVEDDGFELNSPIIFEEGKATLFELVSGANAFASPAGGNFLEIKFYGAYVSNRF